MDTDQISTICEFLVRGAKFLGVFPRNLIPLHFSVYPCCFIANTDNSDEAGEHWVAYFISLPNVIEFFDSFGKTPDYYHFKLKTNLINTEQVQSDNSDFCGQFCIYYLVQRSLRSPLSFILCRFSKSNFQFNDNLVKSFILPLLYSRPSATFKLSHQSCVAPIHFKYGDRCHK